MREGNGNENENENESENENENESENENENETERKKNTYLHACFGTPSLEPVPFHRLSLQMALRLRSTAPQSLLSMQCTPQRGAPCSV